MAVIGALALTGMIGASAVAVELGQGYSTLVDNQRVADLSALAAAVAFSANGAANYTKVAEDVARANGVNNGVDGALVTVTPNNATTPTSLTVVVRTRVQVKLAKILTARTSYNVAASATVALNAPSAAACITALGATTVGGVTSGIMLSGATTLSASGCAINTNGKARAEGSSSITAKSMQLGLAKETTGTSTINAVSGGTITQNMTAAGKTAATNPLPATDPRLVAEFNKIGTSPAPTSPNVATGTDFTPTWNGSYSHSGYAGSWNGSTNTWTFPSGTYTIKDMNLQGGQMVIFTAPVTITVSGELKAGGIKGLKIGEGGTANLTVKGATNMQAENAIVIGAGRHYFGPLTTGTTLTLGAGDKDFNGTLTISGWGTTVTLGNGVYKFGKTSGNTKSIDVLGSSILKIGDGAFSTTGDIIAAGGSSITFGVATSHLVGGKVEINGSGTFGAGTYTITGNLDVKAGGQCNGQNCLVSGMNVMFILGGTLSQSGGTYVDFAASNTNPVPDLIVATHSNVAMSITGGVGGNGSTKLSGMIWAPNSDFSMSGATGINASSSSNCFMLVARTVTLSGSTAGATSCTGITGGGSTPTAIKLTL